MKILGLLASLFVLLLGISFAVLNASPVSFHYYFGDVVLPLSLLLVMALIIGVCLGLLTSFGMYLRVKRQQRALKKAKKHSETSIIEA